MDRWFFVWVIVIALFNFFEAASGVDVKWSDSGVKVEKITEDTQKKSREPSAGNMSEIKEADGPKGSW